MTNPTAVAWGTTCLSDFSHGVIVSKLDKQAINCKFKSIGAHLFGIVP